jgi:hypothetical protein
MKTIIPRSVIAAFACLLLAACSLIAPFDQASYEHATSAKVDTLALMDKATGSYSDHQKEIEALNIELDKAYEYDRGRSLNKLTVAQWEILRSPTGDLVGTFLITWKARGSLGAGIVREKKIQIGKAFDKIIALENGKLKAAAGNQ